MHPAQTWQQEFVLEIENALSARLQGNEGKARVCARRAAGIVAGEYLYRRKMPMPGSSAYSRLKYLANATGIDQNIRDIAGHFILHITPEHNLPISADLVAEALQLAETLLGYTKA